MPAETTASGARQGFSQPWRERLPMPAPDAMTPEQREAAQALIAGPRKGVYGPFLPLLRSPQLLDRVAKVGEYLRFESVLETRIRELVTCAAARHVTNQFEWLMHAPLALKAGVSEATLDALRAGARPKGLPGDEEAALDFTTELLKPWVRGLHQTPLDVHLLTRVWIDHDWRQHEPMAVESQQ